LLLQRRGTTTLVCAHPKTQVRHQLKREHYPQSPQPPSSSHAARFKIATRPDTGEAHCRLPFARRRHCKKVSMTCFLNGRNTFFNASEI
jgi:hypothetical protein